MDEATIMVVSRCRGIGPPSSGIVLGTLFLLAADLRRHTTMTPGVSPQAFAHAFYHTNPRPLTHSDSARA